MISAVLYRDGNRLTGYSASGHSDYAEEGSDIVCAAVSVLGCTCVNALESVCGVQVLMKENGPGILAFDLPMLAAKEDREAQILMGALKQGLTDIQDNYPQNLHLSIKERRK